MLPTLRQLQYLKLLAHHQSFMAASEAAHVSQPALSSGIAELEKILGARLVDRARGKVILTKVGEETLKRAEDILARAEDLVEAAQAANHPLSGRFRLGVIPTVAPYLLPKALVSLRKEFPQLKLFLREDQTARLITALKSGSLDAAIIALPYDLGGLDHAFICRDAILAAMPSDHPLARGASISPDDLKSEELILLEDGHCLRDHALGACQWSGGSNVDMTGPQTLAGGFAATSLNTLVQMVGSGLGVSLLPAMAVEAGLAGGSEVSIRPLSSDKAFRDIVVIWRAGSSRAAEARLLAKTLQA
ncbi:LysR substrate-binding domain-containing protein [Asticcacaulis sp. SL142]|uniref:hydrogen peroxide-inducible genes activator n=1 Tax=Asticcacaulis sp. SL142 TaxID=2995155 RepID=UPI00226CAC87|nr:hydrogen peroxide-inducible genes activator [Asticcacaulis sp. SL142]WAC47631.1 LysR substrate-binding domain-containing protein [Asticcacaulis sp. SL142]